jgi:carbamoyl-phosphate synthase large subunit
MSVSSSRREDVTRGDPISVLVTAIGGVGYGEQILKALRLVGGYSIVGGDVDPSCSNFALVDHPVVLPVASDPEYLDAVLAVCRAFDVQAVFNGCEPELRVVSEGRDRLEEAGLFVPMCPRNVIDVCMDKRRTMSFLQDHGFGHPRVTTLAPDQIDEVDLFPVVLKPAVGGGGSADCYLAQTPRELALVAELIGERSSDMIVQEYVGRPNTEFTVGVLHDMDGNFLNSIAVRREFVSPLNVRLRVPNRTGRDDLGDTLLISSGFSQGTVGRFPEVTGPCERLATALGVRGAVNIQCRVDDEGPKVFEINPRFSGTTSLRAMVGYNEPDVLVRRHLLGERIEPRFPYESRRIHRSLLESFVPDGPAPSWERVWTEPFVTAPG